MKVIPVAGLSGSGKTTFIRALLPLLSRSGPVGTVKHIGHHPMELPDGKDTTVMIGAGALAVAGIDQEKTIITLKSTSLSDALDILSGQGIACAVVEGYKRGPFPKIAMGDVDVQGCILRNPSPDDVIRSLDRFPSYFTIDGILRELRDECREEERPPALASAALPLGGRWDEKALSGLEQSLPGLAESTRDLPGACRVRLAVQRGTLFGKADELLIAVAAGSGEAAAAALAGIISRCREELRPAGVGLRG